MRVKHQTPAQRVANPVWLRDQLTQLVRDYANNIVEDQKLAADTRDDDRRKLCLERIENSRYWKQRLERILRGKTPAEELNEFLQREGVGR